MTFNNCKLGRNASLIEFGVNANIFTDSISDLHVIINNDTINNPYPTQDGYKISGPSQRNFHIGKFELQGHAKVSMKPVALRCTEMILNPGTEFRADGSRRADGSLEYWTRFDVYKNVVNNGSLIVDAISWVNHPSQRNETLPYSLSGTGTFRNKIIQASATASFSNLSFSTFNPRGIDIRTPISVDFNAPFQNDSIKVNLISDVLFGFEPTYNSSFPNSRVVCDGTGSLLLKRGLNQTFNTTIPIGTANFATPLKISQTGNNAADTFRIRALPITSTLDASQCFPVMWEIKESTAGGNLGFAAAPILYNKYFSSRFSAPIMRLYEKKNSAWLQKNTAYTVSNSSAFQFWQFNTGAAVGNFLGKDTLAVACGNGLLNESGSVSISKLGGSINFTDPNSWEDGVVPVSNQPIYIKQGTNIVVNTPIIVNDLNIEGSLTISPGQSLTIGENKNNAVLYSTGTLAIGSGTINVNGEFIQDRGTLTMNGGTINIDPNSGNAATSRTLTNSFFGNTSVLNILNAAACNITGNINFLDPISGGGNVGSYYNLTSTNSNVSGINFTYGDGISSGGTSTDQFRDNLIKLTSLDNITINTGAEANNIFLNTATSSVNVKNITVNPNSILNTNAAHSIFLYGNLTSNGSMNYTTGTPTVFVSANSNFMGSGLINLSTLSFGAGCSLVQLNLNNRLSVTNINFSNSTKLVLNNSNLLYSRNTNLASSASYIVPNGAGKVYDFVGPNSSRFFPIGTFTSYSPIRIIGASSGHTSDSIYVSVKDSVNTSGTTGNTYTAAVVNKTWDISEAVAGGSNLTVTPQWNAVDELNGFTRSSCGVSHFTNGSWDNFTPIAAIGTNPYSVSRAGITSFSPFSVANSISVLPVKWISFNATSYNKTQVNLTWTVQESDVSKYVVERSFDGILFIPVKEVISIGSGINNYSYDDTKENRGVCFYRIKQVSLDGGISFSKIVRVHSTIKESILVFPNPFSDMITLTTANQELIGKSFTIISVDGKVINTGKFTPTSTRLNLSKYKAGVYFLKIENILTLKLVKRN